MATWEEFEALEPDFAEFGLVRLRRYGIGLGFLATLRHDDGGPRVHPCCPILAGGRLYVSIGESSPKVKDMRTDPRYMLHAFPDEGDPEFSVRGRAREVTDPDERARVIAAIDFAAYDPDDPIFEFDIERADSTLWKHWGTAETYPVRRRWLAEGAGLG